VLLGEDVPVLLSVRVTVLVRLFEAVVVLVTASDRVTDMLPVPVRVFVLVIVLVAACDFVGVLDCEGVAVAETVARAVTLDDLDPVGEDVSDAV
jgi:hypothetical protein